MTACEIEQRDFRDTIARARDLGGADLVFTSPPYADARTYGNSVSWEMRDYEALGQAIFDGLRPGGTAVINLSAPVRQWPDRPLDVGKERGLHAYRFLLYCADVIGFRCPDVLVYGRQGAPGLFPNGFRADHEPLLWLQRPGGDFFFDKRSVARPAKTTGWRAIRVRQPDGSLNLRDGTGWAVEQGMAHRGTVWDYGNVGGFSDDPVQRQSDHPARFSVRLAVDVVRCFCPPGGLVVDPFVGSGTTAVAAISNGRSFVGGDLFARPEDGLPWAEVAHRAVAQHSGAGGPTTAPVRGPEPGDVFDLFGA